MQHMKSKMFFLFIVLCFTSIANANNNLDDLRFVTVEELNFDQLDKSEQDYIMKLMFASMNSILPDHVQNKIIDSEYQSLEDVMEQIQYSKLWIIEYKDSNLFKDYPIKLFRFIRMDLTPKRIITHVLYDEAKKTYRVVGFEEINPDSFNENVKIDIDSSATATKYLLDYIVMTKYYTKIIDDQWFYTHSFANSSNINLCPPENIFSSDKFFLIRLFVERQINERESYMSEIIGIVSTEGQILFLEEIVENLE